MTDQPSVLYVCVHNAGRSQMAAAYTRTLSGGAVEVRSAGSAPADTINPAVREAMLEEGIDLRRARIVDRLHQSGPTVSQTVSRMERDGLVVLHRDRSLGLTQTGHDRAQAVMRRHRLVECLLTEVIGLEWEYVHDEACRWEHVMSETVERRLLEVLKSAVGDLSAHAQTPVFLSAMDVRRFLRRFLANNDMDLPVLSHKEVAPHYKVQPLAMLSLK